jgi:hypothetical protein
MDKAARWLGHIVRDAVHIVLLQTEGVALDINGRLLDQAAFWDFTLECEERHANKVAAAAATPHGGSSSTTEDESGSDTGADTDKDTDKDTDEDLYVYTASQSESDESVYTDTETESESDDCVYTAGDSEYIDDGEEEDSD